MQLTSEIKTTDINHKHAIYNLNYYKDNYTVPYTKGFTEYLNACPTRYNPAFYAYKTDGIIGASLAYYGEYTELELALLRNFTNPETIVYDIGANIGYHTVGLAKTSKHVYAFEPNQKNLNLLHINTTHDKNVDIFECAISDHDGTTIISDYELGKMGNYGECKLSDTGQECIKRSIDSLIKENLIEPPNVIKIDVEGHEYEVFKGMEDTIKNNLPIILYEAMHCDLASIYDMLNGLAYTLYWFPVPNYNPDNFYKNKENIFGNGGVLNILAVPFHVTLNTTLPVVMSRDQTYQQVVEEMLAKQNAKSD